MKSPKRLLLSAILVVGGCFRSLHPVYTPERVGSESIITAPTSEIQAFLLRHVKAFKVDPPWERLF